MIDTDMPCFICGEPPDPRELQMVFIPKAWAHMRHQAEGVDCMEAAKRIPCCDAATILNTFGGMLVQRYDGVPSTELWEADNVKKRLVRYRIEKGRLIRIAAPKEMDDKSQEQAEVGPRTEEEEGEQCEGSLQEKDLV